MKVNGIWSGNVIESIDKEIRFKTKDNLRECKLNVRISGFNCYTLDGNEIEILNSEYLVTIPHWEYAELLEIKQKYEEG